MMKKLEMPKMIANTTILLQLAFLVLIIAFKEEIPIKTAKNKNYAKRLNHKI